MPNIPGGIQYSLHWKEHLFDKRPEQAPQAQITDYLKYLEIIHTYIYEVPAYGCGL